MEVLDLTYINETSKVQQLIEFSVGTSAEQEQVERAGKYIEKKVFLDVDKDYFDDGTGTYIYDEDFKFIVLNILECYRLTKDIIVDINTTKSTNKKVDDVSESKTRKDSKDMFSYRGIPCDEDTIASLMGYTNMSGIGNMTIDLSDIL